MKIADLTSFLESLFPLSTQESYDNCGLLVGDKEAPLTSVLLALDCIESIVDEAIEKKCELIVVHHPPIFKGLKSLTGANYIERTVIKAIRNNIAIYAAHTNLDNYKQGVNFEIGRQLGIENPKILKPSASNLTKLVVYVPNEKAETLSNTLFEAGAGVLGNYSECSFQTEGIGTFLPSLNANPALGKHLVKEAVDEVKIEVLVQNHLLSKVVSSMVHAHPYEEVAYDLIPLTNKNNDLGAGMFGDLKIPIAPNAFLAQVKEKFHCGIIRHTKLASSSIQRVAWCGGSGSFLLPDAKRVKADIFITGDYKYHEFFDAEEQIVIADIGHFESEQFTTKLLGDIITKKFPKFALHLTGINTNPIKYF